MAVKAKATLFQKSIGSTVDTVLHDVIAAGILAASIFVKNPAHQQTAANLINAVSQLLPLLDAQLSGSSTAAATNTGSNDATGNAPATSGDAAQTQ